MGLLFAYLSGSWLRATLGRPYLPLALLVAAVGPIVADMAQQLAGTASPARTALIEPARLYFWLLPPLVIVSAQYAMRALLLFTLGTALLPVLLLLGAGAERALLLNVATNAGARLFLFTVAGFLIGRISGAQRAQRHELAQKNAQLAHYVTVHEQLAISRERNRLARDLHDTLAHTLSAISVQLNALDVVLPVEPTVARATLQQIQQLTRDGLHESRRALHALRAQSVDALGFIPALRRLAEQSAERSGVVAQLNLPPALPALPPTVEQQLYRIAEEAIANSVRHARARQLAMSLRHMPTHLHLRIADDGVGFNTALVPQNGHYGLQGIRERAALIGATVTITSVPEHGTTIEVAVALPGGAL
ncbi:MAG: sensor histidine kinase [Chloroflexales bacterium]|nr:sensor histidine kinase [Chloroflexales bacterium]